MDFELVLSNENSNGADSPPSTFSEDFPLDEYERISALSQAELTLMGDLEDVKVSSNLLEDAKDACRKRITAILEFSKGRPLGGDEDCGIHVLDENQLRQIDEWRNPNFESDASSPEAPDEPASAEQTREEAASAEISPAEADQEEPALASLNANIRHGVSTSKAPAEPASAEQAPDEAAKGEPAQEEAFPKDSTPAPVYGPNAVLKKIPEWTKKYKVHEADLPSHRYPVDPYRPGTTEAKKKMNQEAGTPGSSQKKKPRVSWVTG
ncbi:hypothetical protein L3Y34_019026 [Caenorhabditis briggsae]|uniref:Uncharacterized protein n=1 Tax=Caenorhabditis briggsae TaxID=6238 RepID=A0AAE9DNU6_CAEBR|nr:hypothetical protein L3Y34_019026 [Caenorhabditis briggsae]